ncbi:hypothetical protein K439DRAFT_1363891 [Ramaria rubella]|nr:hypothetical protein K439DRAFT_1363891 [Ramaria rubella]
MQKIIEEQGLWPAEGLRVQCNEFKCEPGHSDCCCRRLLFTQRDFCSQKSQLEKYITLHGHICDFYPKFHCELNFIEQYWGAAKLQYCSSPRTANIEQMEKNILDCLDDVSGNQILRYANHSARFMDAYRKGLDGAQAIWANRHYHGHHVLPNSILEEFDCVHETQLEKGTQSALSGC